MLRSQLCKCWRSDQTMQYVYICLLYSGCSFGHQPRSQYVLWYLIYHILYSIAFIKISALHSHELELMMSENTLHTLCLLGTPKLFCAVQIIDLSGLLPTWCFVTFRLRVGSKGTSISLNPCVILCLIMFASWTANSSSNLPEEKIAVAVKNNSNEPRVYLFLAPCLRGQSPLENTPGSIAAVEYHRFSQCR